MRVSSTALSLLLATYRTAAFGSLGSTTISRQRSLAFTRNLSVSLLPKLISSSSSLPASSFSEQRNKKDTLATSSSSSSSSLCLANHVLLNTRGGSTSTSSNQKRVVLNSAVTDEAATSEPVAPIEYFRSDYTALTNIVSKINMDFNIEDGKTTVTSEMKVEPNPNGVDGGDLLLDGDETAVKLLSLQINGKDLVEGHDYELKPAQLIIKASALYGGSDGNNDEAILKTVVEIVPEENTQLSGLYKSGPMYCTQCEAMGFRRITYYP